jgi:multiple sugar transport system permease protein
MMMRRQDTPARREALTAWCFILPFLAFFVFFKLYPMVYGFFVSFLDRNSARKLNDLTFVGFSNYVKVIESETARMAFLRTLEFSLIYTVLTMGAALVMAVLFNRKFRGRTAVRTVFYMPYVTNIIAVGIVWKYLLHPYEGPVNALFKFLGTPEEKLPPWLSGAFSALPTTAFIAAWAALAFPLITFLAVMQDSPRDLYEVAELEGVSTWQRFWHVTLPLLMPTIFLLLTITIINSFKNFSVIAGLTAGGPGTATLVASYQIYNDAFSYMKFGIAAAEGVLLTLLIFLINALVTAGRRKWEN